LVFVAGQWQEIGLKSGSFGSPSVRLQLYSYELIISIQNRPKCELFKMFSRLMKGSWTLAGGSAELCFEVNSDVRAGSLISKSAAMEGHLD